MSTEIAAAAELEAAPLFGEKIKTHESRRRARGRTVGERGDGVAKHAAKPTSVPTTEPEPAPAATRQGSAAASTSDPYHTNVYPNNICSEKLICDADGNLIGKAITDSYDLPRPWYGGQLHAEMGAATAHDEQITNKEDIIRRLA